MIPEILKSKMQEEGYSVQSLAEQCKIPEERLTAWLQGTVSYDWKDVMRLATALNTSMDYLAGLTDVKDPYPGSSIELCEEICESSVPEEKEIQPRKDHYRAPPRERKKANLPYPQNLFTYAGMQDLRAEELSENQLEALAFILSTLSEEKQLIVRMYFQEDAKQPAIAKKIGKSNSWVSLVVQHAAYVTRINRSVIEMGYAAYMKECEEKQRKEEEQRRYIEEHPEMTPIRQSDLPWAIQRRFRDIGLKTLYDVAEYIKADEEYYRKLKGYGPHTDKQVKAVLRQYGIELE